MSEEKSTLRLLLEFNAAAIIVPSIVLGAVYAYSEIFSVPLTRQIWKTTFFIAWSGTLLVFLREFFKAYINYRSKKKRIDRKHDKTLIK